MIVDVEAVVLENHHLSAHYNVITLAAPEIAAVTLPGQFVMVKSAASSAPLLRRPFSIFEISRDTDGIPLGFTLLSKKIGRATAHLYDARQGDRILCLGPLGTPFAPVLPPQEAWMVAGGVGLAPFATLGEALRSSGTKTTLFYGARRAEELFCLDVFERMDIDIVTATEDGSLGSHGFVTDPLQQALARRPSDHVIQIYCCGPTAMMRRVSEVATLHGRSCLVSLEQVMGCGLGGCYSCVVRVRQADAHQHLVRSCLAGPVFDGQAVVWEELVH